MTLNEYIHNPCAVSSLPYWKTKRIIIPNNMMILHDKDYSNDLLDNYYDERYFRLYHDLKTIDNRYIDGYEIITAKNEDLRIIVDIINKSYDDIHASCEQFESYTRAPVYDPDLWIMIRDKASGNYVGCGIADYDSEAKELILEWIQVLPEHRRKGIGQFIVNELLNRGKCIADFATVSSKVDNATKPEFLYRKCGFTGNDVWHVLCRN